MSSKSPLPERQFARSSQGCAFLFLKISKFSGGSVSVFSKLQNLAVGWGMKKPYLENLGPSLWPRVDGGSSRAQSCGASIASKIERNRWRWFARLKISCRYQENAGSWSPPPAALDCRGIGRLLCRDGQAGSWVAGTPPDSGFILPAGSADIDTSQRINKRRNEALKFGPRSAAPDV